MSLAILCSGQGAQHPGMLNKIIDHPLAYEVIRLGEVQLGFHIEELLDAPDGIYRNTLAQPLICMIQMAIWTFLCKQVRSPVAFCGYSVGELSAYACAGALDVHELVRIATARAAVMDHADAAKSSGLVVLQGLRRDEVIRLVANHHVWIAIAISEHEFVIGGKLSELDKLAVLFENSGGKLTKLKVGLASHTPLLDEAVESFRLLLMSSTMIAPSLPVLAGIDATWVTQREIGIEKLSLQLNHTIEWASCLDMLYERGFRFFLELGPGRVLSRHVQARYQDVVARSVDDFNSLDGVISWLEKYSL